MRLFRSAGCTVVAVLAFVGCAGSHTAPDRAASVAGDAEAVSLLGRPLVRPALSADFRARQEAALAKARARYEANRDDADALIWIGRRLAYLGRYRDAVARFSEGMERFPADARFLRHRGHRYITLRRFEDAVSDLSRAAEMIEGQADRVEPDGLPNVRNLPRSSLHTNVWYHLGLAQYLRGDFAASVTSYERCRDAGTNDDNLVSSSYWLYLGLRRLGRASEAAGVLTKSGGDLDIIENDSYARLLHLCRGDPASAAAGSPLMHGLSPGSTDYNTLSYGIGAWHLVNGRPARARATFERVVLAGAKGWAAFGYIAAEAEVARAASPGGSHLPDSLVQQGETSAVSFVEDP